MSSNIYGLVECECGSRIEIVLCLSSYNWFNGKGLDSLYAVISSNPSANDIKKDKILRVTI